MRIPLSVEKAYSDRYFAFASYFIQVPSLRVDRPLRALIDTGSPYTTISPTDALHFQLPIRHWGGGKGVEVVELAGHKFFRHPVDSVSLSFRDDKNVVVTFNGRIHVLVPTKMDTKTMEDVQVIPSIIGNDFLEDNKLALVFCPSLLTASLEQP